MSGAARWDVKKVRPVGRRWEWRASRGADWAEGRAWTRNGAIRMAVLVSSPLFDLGMAEHIADAITAANPSSQTTPDQEGKGND